MKLHHHAGCLVISFTVAIFPLVSHADENYADGWLGSPYKQQRMTNFNGSASVSGSGITGTFNSSTTPGRVQVNLSAYPAQYPNTFGYSSASGTWYDTVTIQPDNPALVGTGGTAAFTYYLNGTASSTDYQTCQFNVSTECQCGGPSTSGGTPANSSFTISRPFTFGAPFQISMTLGCLAHGYSEATISESLSAGGISVTDSDGNTAGYSSVSAVGTGRSVVLTNGDSYTGISITNSVGHQTQAALLAGSANANETVVANFSGSHGTNGLFSDVLDLSGTDTNLFALQMIYDDISAVAQLGDEAKVQLQWFDPLRQIWTNAIYGNSDGGTNNHFFLGAFDPGKFQLGNWGVDTVAHVVWGVFNHNSRFAVGGVLHPALRCYGVTLQTNGVMIQLQGQALSKSQYFVDQCADLTLTNWTVIGRAVPDDNGSATFLDTNAIPAVTNTQRFYRVRQ